MTYLQAVTSEPSEALAAIREVRVVPVVALPDADDAVGLTTALVGGGLPIVEITLRTAAGLEGIRLARDLEGAIVGAGTVTNVGQAEAAIDAGARFVVSPGLDADIVRACQAADVPVVPGIATPSELMQAVSLGLVVVKVFPAAMLGGPAMIKALAALGLDVEFLPTGGVTLENAATYLDHPKVVAVGGTWMVPRSAIEARDWTGITDLARDCRPLRSAD
jgi:2-dehydro-3-deoxyphosphogluconate aldolase/(4S)-4-hydroxy-2-oxoglutarate aldolase